MYIKTPSTPVRVLSKGYIPLSPLNHLLGKVALLLMLIFSSSVYASGDGLSGQYWNYDVSGNGYNFPTTTPDLTRVDATVDSNWGSGSPDSTINNDDFAISWQGEIEITETGNHTFHTQSDDGVKLWINNQLIISNWTTHASTWNNSAQINLTAGERYSIKMGFFEHTGQAEARLHWQTPSNNTRHVIPQSQLYSQGSSGPSPGSCSIDQ
jgi:hypothetical protein